MTQGFSCQAATLCSHPVTSLRAAAGWHEI
jgi:hypothetical protein